MVGYSNTFEKIATLFCFFFFLTINEMKEPDNNNERTTQRPVQSSQSTDRDPIQYMHQIKHNKTKTLQCMFESPSLSLALSLCAMQYNASLYQLQQISE